MLAEATAIIWEFTRLMVSITIAGVAIGVWLAIYLSARCALKQWRLYSPHPLARRIRRHLRARRKANAS